MDRKTFLKTSFSLGTGLLAAPAAGAGVWGSGAFSASLNEEAGRGAKVPLSILFTGDTHARYAPFPATAGPLAGLGGLERRAAYIEAVRATGRHVLLLDTGDFLDSRTAAMEPFGAAEVFGWMERLGYDAAVPGNHDLQALMGSQEWPISSLPLLLSNYRYNDKVSELKERLHEYRVKEYGGIKVGLFGLGPDLSPLAAPGSALREGLAHRSPRYLAESMVRRLRRIEGCDLVICLSHLGYAPGDWRSRQRGRAYSSQSGKAIEAGSASNGHGSASGSGDGEGVSPHTGYGILQEELALFQDPPADARRTWAHTAGQREKVQRPGSEVAAQYDIGLARRVEGIDLILGGHTHTFMNRPTVVQNPGGGTTTIAHTGHGGAYIGRIDLDLSRTKGKARRKFVSAELKEIS